MAVGSPPEEQLRAPAAATPHLSGALVILMSVSAGVSVANLYYNQPLLALMGRSFPQDARMAAYLPTFTQIGVALGMFLFVPLGDIRERRGLIALVCCAVALTTALNAAAQSMAWLMVASFALGLTSVVPHLILPFAAQLAPIEERGRVVGTVLGGLLIGILLARTASGLLGAALGWRAVYWFATGCMLVLAAVMRRCLPASPPTVSLRYGGMLRSIGTLVREQPVLREASVIGGMLFGAFSAFWATLVYLLSTPPYHYGAKAAGLFGLVGVIGAAAAPAAGRLADKRSPRFTVGISILVSFASFAAFYVLGYHLWGLVIGVLLLDLGVQAGHVSNQTRIYALLPEARSRLNTVYMVSYFLGGTLGSALGAYGWNHWQWTGVCAAGTVLLAVAGVAHWAGRNAEGRQTQQ